MKFYFIRAAYFAQVESYAIFGLRLGYTCMGIAHWPMNGKRRTRWMPHLLLTLWSHTGCCDQRWVAKIDIGRYMAGYRTVGDATPDLYAYSHRGLKFKFTK